MVTALSSQARMIRRGQIVRTNYNTGPYLITDVSGPCACAEYLRHLDGDESPSEAHYHVTCTNPDGSGHSWLNGYRLNGTSVWSKDRIIIVGEAETAQQELFI